MLLKDCKTLYEVNCAYGNIQDYKNLLIPYTRPYFERFFDLRKQIKNKYLPEPDLGYSV
jgi:hypothetical protein